MKMKIEEIFNIETFEKLSNEDKYDVMFYLIDLKRQGLLSHKTFAKIMIAVCFNNEYYYETAKNYKFDLFKHCKSSDDYKTLSHDISCIAYHGILKENIFSTVSMLAEMEDTED